MAKKAKINGKTFKVPQYLRFAERKTQPTISREEAARRGKKYKKGNKKTPEEIQDEYKANARMQARRGAKEIGIRHPKWADLQKTSKKRKTKSKTSSSSGSSTSRTIRAKRGTHITVKIID